MKPKPIYYPWSSGTVNDFNQNEGVWYIKIDGDREQKKDQRAKVYRVCGGSQAKRRNASVARNKKAKQ
jgi:hypothetical protein